MYSEAFRDKYIEAYISNGFSKTKACKVVGISYETQKLWMKEEAFKKKFVAMEMHAMDVLIEEAENTHRVVRLGIPKKNKDGDLIGWKERPDMRGIEWFLSRVSKKYNETLNIKHSGDEDSPIKISYK